MSWPRRERPLSSSRLSSRKLHIMVRSACVSLGSCRKVTVAPCAITVWLDTCTHLASLRRYARGTRRRIPFARISTAYTLTYVQISRICIRVCARLISVHSRLARSAFVYRAHGLPGEIHLPLCMYIYLSMRTRKRVAPIFAALCARRTKIIGINEIIVSRDSYQPCAITMRRTRGKS